MEKINGSLLSVLQRKELIEFVLVSVNEPKAKKLFNLKNDDEVFVKNLDDKFELTTFEKFVNQQENEWPEGYIIAIIHENQENMINVLCASSYAFLMEFLYRDKNFFKIDVNEVSFLTRMKFILNHNMTECISYLQDNDNFDENDPNREIDLIYVRNFLTEITEALLSDDTIEDYFRQFDDNFAETENPE
jgi:hypothetical protein